MTNEDVIGTSMEGWLVGCSVIAILLDRLCGYHLLSIALKYRLQLQD